MIENLSDDKPKRTRRAKPENWLDCKFRFETKEMREKFEKSAAKHKRSIPMHINYVLDKYLVEEAKEGSQADSEII